MRRVTGVVLGAVLATGVLVAGSAAAHCGDDAGGKAHDPFGSCENGNGRVRCGDGTDVGGLFILSTAEHGSGAQVCNRDGEVPVWGRATVWTDGERVIVGADGDSATEPGNGWTRVDAGSDGCVRARRGEGNGSYYTAGDKTSSPDVDQRVCA